MRLCGISSHFWLLSPLYKAGYPRVTHPSATNFSITRFHEKSVRLACVKHAASVHPEPGSNSHVKMFITWVFVLPEIIWHYCCFEWSDFSNLVLWIFSLWFVSADADLFTMESSGLHYCLFVKEHRCFLSRQLVYNITGLLRCQQLFLFFSIAYLTNLRGGL